MIVDADERISDQLMAEIRDVLSTPPKHLDGYWISFRCYFMGHPLRFAGWNTAAFRLVRRDRCRYRMRRVHEEIRVEAGRAGRLRGKLLHYSYWTYDEYFRKYIRYTRWGAEELQDRGRKASAYGLLVRPALRFLQLYLLRGGFLDGLPGLQVCMLTAFFNTFMKQARLWEMQQALPQPDPEAEIAGSIRESHMPNGCRPRRDPRLRGRANPRADPTPQKVRRTSLSVETNSPHGQGRPSYSHQTPPAFSKRQARE